MSTYIEYKCKTCGESSDDSNIKLSRIETLREIWANRAHIHAILNNISDVEISIFDNYRNDFYFVCSHITHNVAIIDEYGKEYSIEIPLAISR